MNSEKKSLSTFDEIVFEHFNKDYGAFILRKEYKKHMGIAILVGVLICAIVAGFSFLPEKEEDTTEDTTTKVVSISDLAPPPPIKETPPPPPPKFKLPPPPKKTVKFVAPKITEKVVPEEMKMATIEEVKKAPVISTTDIDLPDPGQVVFKEPPKEIGTGEVVVEPKIFRRVEEMPSFPGGKKAMYEFLYSNLEFPEYAKETGIEGTVYVRFVVSESGKITSIKIVRGLSEGIDKEVIRVIKKMPVWNPGKQNGHPVNVQFTLPVVFKLQ